MKIQINQKEIFKAINVAFDIASEKLNHNIGVFFIKSQNNKIELIASNEHTFLHQNLNGIIFHEGEIIIEANVFLNIIKNIKDKLFSIYETDEMIFIEADAKFRLNKLNDKILNFDFFRKILANSKIEKLLNNSSNVFNSSDFNLHSAENSQLDKTNNGYLLNSSSDANVLSSENFDYTNFLILTKDELFNLLKLTKFAVLNQESRVTLNSLAIIINNNQITSYCMDGHRLAKYNIAKSIPTSHEILLSIKLVDQILSILNSFNIENIILDICDKKTIQFLFIFEEKDLVNNNYVKLNLTTQLTNTDENDKKSCQVIQNLTTNKNLKFITLISTLVNAELINYQKIIPNIAEYKIKFEINVGLLIESILSVTAISNEKFKILKFSLFSDSKIEIITYGQNGALGKKILTCSLLNSQTIEENSNTNLTTTNIDENQNIQNTEENSVVNAEKLITIGINYRYLLDVLEVIKTTAVIEMKNNVTPLIITSKDNLNSLFLIMPIKV